MQILPATADYLHRYEEIHRCKSSREDDAVDPSLRCVGSGNGVRSDFSDGLPSPIQHSGAPTKTGPDDDDSRLRQTHSNHHPLPVHHCDIVPAQRSRFNDGSVLQGGGILVGASPNCTARTKLGLVSARRSRWNWPRAEQSCSLAKAVREVGAAEDPQRDLLAPERPRIAREEWPGVNKPR
jgi:hypothetical protein